MSSSSSTCNGALAYSDSTSTTLRHIDPRASFPHSSSHLGVSTLQSVTVASAAPMPSQSCPAVSDGDLDIGGLRSPRPALAGPDAGSFFVCSCSDDAAGDCAFDGEDSGDTSGTDELSGSGSASSSDPEYECHDHVIEQDQTRRQMHTDAATQAKNSGSRRAHRNRRPPKRVISNSSILYNGLTA